MLMLMLRVVQEVHSKRAAALPVLLCGAVVLANPALAGIGDGNSEIGFDVGGTDFDSDVSDEDGTLFGVRGGHHFTDTFQLEGQVTSSSAEEGPVDLTLTTFFVNAVFNFHPGPNTTPYILVGAGQADLEVDVFGITIDDDGDAFQVAGGGRFFVGSKKKMAIRAELSVVNEETFNEDSTHTNLTVGLTWRLGPE